MCGSQTRLGPAGSAASTTADGAPYQPPPSGVGDDRNRAVGGQLLVSLRTGAPRRNGARRAFRDGLSLRRRYIPPTRALLAGHRLASPPARHSDRPPRTHIGHRPRSVFAFAQVRARPAPRRTLPNFHTPAPYTWTGPDPRFRRSDPVLRPQWQVKDSNLRSFRDGFTDRRGQAEPHGVVGFEVILDAYSLLLIAATSPVSRSGYSSAMDPSDR